jgi:hypothetical protein
MAELRPCPTCKQSISSEANPCPHCGQPDPFQPRSPLDEDRARREAALEARFGALPKRRVSSQNAEMEVDPAAGLKDILGKFSQQDKPRPQLDEDLVRRQEDLAKRQADLMGRFGQAETTSDTGEYETSDQRHQGAIDGDGDTQVAQGSFPRCRTCGQPSPDTFDYCEHCGSSMGNEEQGASAAAMSAHVPNDLERADASCSLMVVRCLAALAGGGFGVVSCRGGMKFLEIADSTVPYTPPYMTPPPPPAIFYVTAGAGFVCLILGFGLLAAGVAGFLIPGFAVRFLALFIPDLRE